MLKLFSEVLVVGGEPSLELSCVNKLGEKKVGSNTCFSITGRPVFTSEFKDIRALLIFSSSFESGFISACSGMLNFRIVDTIKYMNMAGFTHI